MNDQDILEEMGKFGCLALCYIRAGILISGQEPEDGQVLTKLIDVYFNTHFLDHDCSVLDGQGLVNYISKTKCSVDKTKEVSDSLECRNYYYNGNNHWVLFFKGQCIYNSLSNSKCFNCGECKDVRKINYK